jgi:GrpB-like predicted nucleotidyltransferase (UPF0157 family)
MLAGMPDALREPVVLTDPDPAWPDQYTVVSQQVGDALSDLHATIEHIGSTAVPLRGKPILDLQVAIDPAERPSALAALCAIGFACHGEAGVSGRVYLTRRVAGEPAVNVHVFAVGDALLDDNRAIRDFLKAHPEVATEYVVAKEQALAQGHTELFNYSHAKGDCLARIREAACRWSRGL